MTNKERFLKLVSKEKTNTIARAKARIKRYYRRKRRRRTIYKLKQGGA